MQMNLKSTLICIALMSSSAFVSKAYSGDLPRRDQPSGQTFSQPGGVTNWGGFYVGGHLGYGFGKARSADIDGFLIGGHAGFNFQSDRIVGGLEADIDYTDINYRGFADTFRQKWLGSVRGRIGYSYERFLPYFTAGLGYTNGIMKNASGKVENTHVGFVLGVGAEMMLTNNVAARVEFLHYNFGRENYALPVGARSTGISTNVLRVGVSYKF